MRVSLNPSVSRGSPVRRSAAVASVRAVDAALAVSDPTPVEPVTTVSSLGHFMATDSVGDHGQGQNGKLPGKRYALLNTFAKAFD